MSSTARSDDHTSLVGLRLPRLRGGRFVTVKFLVDTGSARTVLMPYDLGALTIEYSALDPTSGIRLDLPGAPLGVFIEPAFVSFSDTDGRTHVYQLDLAIAELSDSTIGHPSILGQDVLGSWLMVHAPREDILEFDVLEADFTFDD